MRISRQANIGPAVPHADRDVAFVHHGGELRVAGIHDGLRLLVSRVVEEAGGLGSEVAGLALRNFWGIPQKLTVCPLALPVPKTLFDGALQLLPLAQGELLCVGVVELAAGATRGVDTRWPAA